MSRISQEASELAIIQSKNIPQTLLFYSDFSTISLEGKVPGNLKFGGAVVVGDRVYFAPYSADVVGVVDTRANEGAGAFHVLSMQDKVDGKALYTSAVVVANKVYFAPFDADCIGVIE